MAKCPLIKPYNIIEFNGGFWVEVEWPEDCRYDIGYQLAHQTERNGRTYMGLFESTAMRLRSHDINGSPK